MANNNELLFKQLNKKVKQDADVRSGLGNYDCGRKHPSIYKQLLQAKAEIGDEYPILGTSLPIHLLKGYPTLDCLQCWLCHNSGEEYESISVFIWTQAYMYIYTAAGIKLLRVSHWGWGKNEVPHLTDNALPAKSLKEV